MKVEELVGKYIQTKAISENDIEQIRTDRELRSSLCSYFRTNKNREFALDLLNAFVALRADVEKGILMDDLMLACYILGLHQEIADCLLMWKAKNVDFDMYCGFDIQLMAFAGAEPAIAYLQTVDSEEAKAALEYLADCGEDFYDQEEYFSPDELPWWV